jgi:O-antigen/teichoic acid export membrane protein
MIAGRLMNTRALWIRTGVSLVGQGLNLVLGVLASIPIGRGLGPSGKGEFALYSWAVGLGVVFLARGWHSAVATVASTNDRRGLEAVRLGRRWLLPFTLGLLTLTLGCYLVGSIGWGFAAATASCQVWAQPASGALVGSGRLGAYYGGVVTQNAVLLAGVGLLWTGGLLTPERAMGVLAAAVACAMVVHSVAAGAGFWVGRATDPTIAELGKLSRDLWLADLAAFLTYRLDVGMVRYFTGTSGLGLYSTAASVAELGRIAPNAIGQAALKELGRVDAQQRRAIAVRTILTGVVTSAAFLGVLAVAAQWFIPMMYGAAFAPAASLVGWLTPGIVSLAVASASASWLAVAGRSAVNARLAWTGCAISSLVSLLLIAVAGITGAAIASSIGYGVLAWMFWRAASRP